MKILTKSPRETMKAAAAFAKTLKPGDIVFLQGDLGAGKTTFVKGLARAFGIDPDQVTSPTFVLMNIYEGKRSIYHFDLYRLDKEEEFRSVNFDDFFYGSGISVIEWAERLGSRKPETYKTVTFTHRGEDRREIRIL